jgi:hypothetical protein
MTEEKKQVPFIVLPCVSCGTHAAGIMFRDVGEATYIIDRLKDYKTQVVCVKCFTKEGLRIGKKVELDLDR